MPTIATTFINSRIVLSKRYRVIIGKTSAKEQGESECHCEPFRHCSEGVAISCWQRLWDCHVASLLAMTVGLLVRLTLGGTGAETQLQREQFLAQPDILRRHFYQLVPVDEVERLFQTHLHRRDQLDGDLPCRSAHVGH